MPILPVPYFVQPTSNTCQATVLKMMASYIDKKRGQPFQSRDIAAIKDSVNTDPRRPNKTATNAWANFHWWLQNEFGDMAFLMDTSANTANAITIIRNSIQGRNPVLVSTNQNMSNSGHIILVVGVMRFDGTRFVEPMPGPIGQNFVFICHDPFGRFGRNFFANDPRWGNRRHEGGLSVEGSEQGPGMFVPYSLEGIRRSTGSFLLIRAS